MSISVIVPILIAEMSRGNFRTILRNVVSFSILSLKLHLIGEAVELNDPYDPLHKLTGRSRNLRGLGELHSER